MNLQQLLGSKFFSKRGYALSLILSTAAALPAAAQTHVVVGDELQAPPAGQNLTVPMGTSIRASNQPTFYARNAGQILILQAGILGEAAQGDDLGFAVAGGLLFTPAGDETSVLFDHSGTIINAGRIGDDTVAEPDSSQALIKFNSGFATITNMSTGILRGGVTTLGGNLFDGIIELSSDGGIVTNKGFELLPYTLRSGVVELRFTEGTVEKGRSFVDVVKLGVDKKVTIINAGSVVTSHALNLNFTGSSSGDTLFDNTGTGSFFGSDFIIATETANGTVKLITSNGPNALASSTISLTSGTAGSHPTSGRFGGASQGIIMNDSPVFSLLTILQGEHLLFLVVMVVLRHWFLQLKAQISLR